MALPVFVQKAEIHVSIYARSQSGLWFYGCTVYSVRKHRKQFNLNMYIKLKPASSVTGSGSKNARLQICDYQDDSVMEGP